MWQAPHRTAPHPDTHLPPPVVLDDPGREREGDDRADVGGPGDDGHGEGAAARGHELPDHAVDGGEGHPFPGPEQDAGGDGGAQALGGGGRGQEGEEGPEEDAGLWMQVCGDRSAD